MNTLDRAKKSFPVGTRCVATDEFGNYHEEKVTVVGHRLNLIGKPLVEVRTEMDGLTTFYTSELHKVTD